MSLEPARKRARTSTKSRDSAVRSDLVYKSYPAYQEDIVDYYSDYIRPRHIQGKGDSVILEIAGGSFSLPFDECFITCTYKIEKKNDQGAWVSVDHTGVDATLAPVQNVLESLFIQYDISINGKIISETSNMFPYVGHVVKLLNYSTEAKNTYLSNTGWHTDTASPDDNSVTNKGWVARRDRIKNGREDVVSGILYSDVCYALAQIPSNTDITLILHKSKPEFFLQGGDATKTYRVDVTDIELETRKYELSAKRSLDIERTLAASGGGIVPFTHLAATNHFIPVGTTAFQIPRLVLGQVPNRIVFGVVSNAAFEGDVTKSPYNYILNGVSNIQLSIDGKPLPTRALDLTNDVKAYENLFRATGQYGMNSTNGITFDQYKNGCHLYVFNTRPDQCTRQDIFPERRYGTVSMRIGFESATSEGLIVIVLCEFDQLYSIDKLRNITSDHGTH